MRFIDTMSPEEIDVLKLKGMLSDNSTPQIPNREQSTTADPKPKNQK